MLHRIFIAINLPLKLKRMLTSYQEEIQKEFSSLAIPSDSLIKFVKPVNFHITLEFLGNLNDEEVSKVCQLCKKVAPEIESFPLVLTNISYGPLKNYQEEENKVPKFIWIRGEPSSQLNNLFSKLDKLLFEGKNNHPSFSPHITLARLRQWRFKRMEIEERPSIDREINLSFEVPSVEVMESELRKDGPRYTVLESIELGSKFID